MIIHLQLLQEILMRCQNSRAVGWREEYCLFKLAFRNSCQATLLVVCHLYPSVEVVHSKCALKKLYASDICPSNELFHQPPLHLNCQHRVPQINVTLKLGLSGCDIIPWVSLGNSFPPDAFGHCSLLPGLPYFHFPGLPSASKQC